MVHDIDEIDAEAVAPDPAVDDQSALDLEVEVNHRPWEFSLHFVGKFWSIPVVPVPGLVHVIEFFDFWFVEAISNSHCLYIGFSVVELVEGLLQSSLPSSISDRWIKID